jgi:hypothetical protein
MRSALAFTLLALTAVPAAAQPEVARGPRRFKGGAVRGASRLREAAVEVGGRHEVHLENEIDALRARLHAARAHRRPGRRPACPEGPAHPWAAGAWAGPSGQAGRRPGRR